MNILLVDDERSPLEYLTRTVEGVLKNATTHGFMKPSEALEFAKVNNVDIAFLDIEMGGMNGLQLAKSLKDINKKVNIIFTTGYSQYAADAFALHASGYLLKPISAEAIEEAIEYLYHPVDPYPKKRVHIQTFGNFEIYIDDRPLKFFRSKTKELLAYLVMRRGARCSNEEVISVIWNKKPDLKAIQNQYRHLVFDLTKTLKSVNADDILLKERNAMAVFPDKFSCDFYDFLSADAFAVNNYMGEFMAQYKWAEFTNTHLEQKI